jgi:hypothetical protein
LGQAVREGKIMATYKTEITIKTDRELTEDELASIERSVHAQLAEPWDFNNNEINVQIEVSDFNFKEAK